MNPPPTAAEREKYDPQKEEAAKNNFLDIAERLAVGGGTMDRAAAWAHASNDHPQAKNFFAEWKAQSLLKKHEELDRLQAARRAGNPSLRA